MFDASERTRNATTTILYYCCYTTAATHLRHENRLDDFTGFDVLPGDVSTVTGSSDPRLESSSVGPEERKSQQRLERLVRVGSKTHDFSINTSRMMMFVTVELAPPFPRDPTERP